MNPSPHTHRDTLAFVLAIIGASAWAMFPVGTLLEHRTFDRLFGLLLVMTVGAFVGAWSAATVWPRVARATPVVAGALCAALVVGVIDLQTCGAIDISARELLLIACVAGAAFVGASLGRFSKVARTPFVAAWITMSSLALLGFGFAIASASGYAVQEDAGGLAILLGAQPGAIAAAILCRGLERRAFCWRVLVLAVAAFSIVALGRRRPNDVAMDGMVAGALAGAILAGHAAFAHWLVRTFRRRTGAALPEARVITPTDRPT